jgi:hypothetical protein
MFARTPVAIGVIPIPVFRYRGFRTQRCHGDGARCAGAKRPVSGSDPEIPDRPDQNTRGLLTASIPRSGVPEAIVPT